MLDLILWPLFDDFLQACVGAMGWQRLSESFFAMAEPPPPSARLATATSSSLKATQVCLIRPYEAQPSQSRKFIFFSTQNNALVASMCCI